MSAMMVITFFMYGNILEQIFPAKVLEWMKDVIEQLHYAPNE